MESTLRKWREGENPTENEELDWRELSLQVQFYAKAAREVLNENAATGSIHLLKGNQRVQVPIDPSSVQAAMENVELAVQASWRELSNAA